MPGFNSLHRGLMGRTKRDGTESDRNLGPVSRREEGDLDLDLKAGSYRGCRTGTQSGGLLLEARPLNRLNNH
jgi:hypothetical protein